MKKTIPVDIFLLNGAWLTCRPIARAAIVNIVFKGYMLGFDKLHEKDYFHLSELDFRSWHAHETVILDALRGLVPVIHKHCVDRLAVRETLSYNGKVARAAKIRYEEEKKKATNNGVIPLTDSNMIVPYSIPLKSIPSKEIQRNKKLATFNKEPAIKKPKGKMLFDKKQANSSPEAELPPSDA